MNKIRILLYPIYKIKHENNKLLKKIVFMSCFHSFMGVTEVILLGKKYVSRVEGVY